MEEEPITSQFICPNCEEPFNGYCENCHYKEIR